MVTWTFVCVSCNYIIFLLKCDSQKEKSSDLRIRSRAINLMLSDVSYILLTTLRNHVLIIILTKKGPEIWHSSLTNFLTLPTCNSLIIYTYKFKLKGPEIMHFTSQNTNFLTQVVMPWIPVKVCAPGPYQGLCDRRAWTPLMGSCALLWMFLPPSNS